ncbi:MAG TPA: hypothetical protein DDW52_27295 [Planctomycetaceae bacterium]|nr:hypothetical protein [Planctomycetaceae bacterium]
MPTRFTAGRKGLLAKELEGNPLRNFKLGSSLALLLVLVSFTAGAFAQGGPDEIISESSAQIRQLESLTCKLEVESIGGKMVTPASSISQCSLKRLAEKTLLAISETRHSKKGPSNSTVYSTVNGSYWFDAKGDWWEAHGESNEMELLGQSHANGNAAFYMFMFGDSYFADQGINAPKTRRKFQC